MRFHKSRNGLYVPVDTSELVAGVPWARASRLGVGGMGLSQYHVAPRGGSSSPPAFTPASISGLLAWHEARFTIDVTLNTTPDPDTVSAWLDHHTTDNDLAQSTAVQQPEWQPTGWNSAAPTPKFGIVSANITHLRNTTGTIASHNNATNASWTVACALQITSTSGVRTLASWGNTSGANMLCRVLSASGASTLSVQLRNSANANLQTQVVASALGTDRHVVVVTYNGATGVVQVYVDGSAETPVNFTPVGASDSNIFSLGAIVRTAIQEGFEGTVPCLFVYGRAINSTEAGQLRDYIKANHSGLP